MYPDAGLPAGNSHRRTDESVLHPRPRVPVASPHLQLCRVARCRCNFDGRLHHRSSSASQPGSGEALAGIKGGNRDDILRGMIVVERSVPTCHGLNFSPSHLVSLCLSLSYLFVSLSLSLSPSLPLSLSILWLSTSHPSLPKPLCPESLGRGARVRDSSTFMASKRRYPTRHATRRRRAGRFMSSSSGQRSLLSGVTWSR